MSAELTDEELTKVLKLNTILAARRSQNRQDDLISAGNMGIMQSLNTFDRSKGAITTHARAYIWRNQNREYTAINKPYNIPHSVSDYPEFADSIPNAEHLSPAMEQETPLEALEDKEELETRIKAMERAIETLSAKDADIIKEFFLHKVAASELAQRYGMSSRVFYIYVRSVLKKLRWTMERAL